MTPLGDTVRLIQHPGADFPLGQRLPQRRTAELFRRDNQNTDVTQAHTVQHIGSFGHRQQAVERRTGRDATRLQSRHLIRHKCHER